MKKKGWTMRKAILVFCIGCVLSALFLQTFLFQESLRRQSGCLVCEIDSGALVAIMNKYVDLSHVYLCLQPTVGNAITHGLRNVRRSDKSC